MGNGYVMRLVTGVISDTIKGFQGFCGEFF